VVLQVLAVSHPSFIYEPILDQLDASGLSKALFTLFLAKTPQDLLVTEVGETSGGLDLGLIGGRQPTNSPAEVLIETKLASLLNQAGSAGLHTYLDEVDPRLLLQSSRILSLIQRVIDGE
jgi:hypothetical protein